MALVGHVSVVVIVGFLPQVLAATLWSRRRSDVGFRSTEPAKTVASIFDLDDDHSVVKEPVEQRGGDNRIARYLIWRKLEVITAPFSYRALTSWKKRLPPPGMTGRQPISSTTRRDARGDSTEALPELTFPLRRSQRGDDVGEGGEKDTRWFDGFTAIAVARWLLPVPGRTEEMYYFGAVDEGE